MPLTLTPNEQRLARICLRTAPDASHQDILDELAGRLLAAKRKDTPIDNPVGYLAQLCRAARDGAFTLTSLGLNVREQRRQEIRLQRLDEATQARAQAHLQALFARPAAADGSAITSPSDSPTSRQRRPGAQTDGSAISVAMDAQSPKDRTEHAPSDGSAITLPHDSPSSRHRRHGVETDGSAISSTTEARCPHDRRKHSPGDGSAISSPADLPDGTAITLQDNPANRNTSPPATGPPGSASNEGKPGR